MFTAVQTNSRRGTLRRPLAPSLFPRNIDLDHGPGSFTNVVPTYPIQYPVREVGRGAKGVLLLRWVGTDWTCRERYFCWAGECMKNSIILCMLYLYPLRVYPA